MGDAEPEEEAGEPRERAEGFVRGFGRVLFQGPDSEDHREQLPPSRRPLLEELVARLTGPVPRSAAVVGPPGVGKSVLLYEAARRAHAEGRLVFEATSGEAVAVPFVGELELRLQQLGDIARGALWVVPDLPHATGAGTYTGNPRGLIDLVLPYLMRGDLDVLGEADEAAFAKLAQLRPAVVPVLRPVRVEPLGRDETLTLASAWLERSGTSMAEADAREALDLAEDYMPQAAAPGSLMALVKGTHMRLARAGQVPEEIAASELLATLAELTGLPAELLDERRPLDVESVRRFFDDRILGQPEAVGVLVERIALVKAGLTDPGRPLGVFLFVGPTGTGKTELAKTLAEYLFGSARRLVRLDMSEYQTADSLERLLAGPQSEETADFVAAVRRSPFSVVLLDEFEKAHPRIWDLFLQLFDDGRLTDRSGQTADFRRCVVIMTSNLGSGPSRSGPIGFTTDIPGGRASSVERRVAEEFRPEFVNRIDRIVTFRPLTREVMRALVSKELAALGRRRGLRTRPWAVEWDASAIDFLLEQGFTRDLGARPLKRAIEDHVLSPLARVIVEQQAPTGDQFLFVRSPDGRRIEVEFIDPELEEPAMLVEPSEAARELSLRAIALDPTGAPAELGYLQRALEAVSERIADPSHARRKQIALEAMQVDGFWGSPGRHEVLREAEHLDRLEAGLGGARSLLRRLVDSGRGEGGRSRRLSRLLALRLYLLETDLAAMEEGDSFDALLELRDDAGDGATRFAERLLEMYERWAEERGMQLERLRRVAGGTAALALGGFGAFRILRSESGLHVFEAPRDGKGFARTAVRVVVVPRPVEPPDPTPQTAEQQAWRALAGAEPSTSIVRRYREEPSPLVRDTVSGWRTGRLDRVLGGDFDLF